MVKYYQVTTEEATLIANFNYEENGVKCLFTAKSGEQENGNFIVRKDLVNKFSEELKLIDFSSKQLYYSNELTPKKVNI